MNNRVQMPAMTVVAVLIAAGWAGCGGDPPKAPGTSGGKQADQFTGRAGAETGQAEPPNLNVGAALTEAECAAFGKAIEDAAADAARLNALIDWDAILDRAMDGIDAPPQTRNRFRRGVLNFVGKTGLAVDIAQSVTDGRGSYKVLRVRVAGSGLRVLVRLLSDAGLTYHDLMPARRSDGKIRAVDIDVAATGELASQTIRRGYLSGLAASQSKSLKTGGWEAGIAVEQMGKEFQGGRAKEALDIYAGLSAPVQKDKTVQLMRIRAAQAVGEAEHGAALADYLEKYPDDPSVILLAIDLHQIRKQHAEALAMVDRLDKALGGDPYLNVMRGNIHIEAGNLAGARAALESVLRQEPDLKDVYMSLVPLSLKEKRFDDTVNWLDALSARKVELGDLSQPIYAEFVKSPQYRDWMKSRAGK